MMVSRDPRRLVVLAGLLLVALWAVQAADVPPGGVGHAATASFEAPTAQLHDGLTGPGPGDLDAVSHLREHVGAARVVARRPGVPRDRGRREADTLSARLTRPPPSA